MPKFLVRARYTAEGMKALRKERASGREKAIAAACASLGGRLEALYYALGDDDAVVIVDMPSHIHVTKLNVAVGASGMASTTTVPLLTIAEADEALGEGVNYRPPGG